MGNDLKLILVAAAIFPRAQRTLACALLAAATVCAQEAHYSQDGAFWVRTLTYQAPAHTHLVVSARAKIVLRGATPDQGAKVVYKLLQRVRARDEAEARRLMPGAGFGAADLGDFTRLVMTPLGPGVTSELQLFVPRQVAVARLDSQGGDIEAYDFGGSVDAATMFGQIRCDRIGGDVGAVLRAAYVKNCRFHLTLNVQKTANSDFLLCGAN